MKQKTEGTERGDRQMQKYSMKLQDPSQTADRRKQKVRKDVPHLISAKEIVNVISLQNLNEN